jgi:hypothetical protein
MVDGHDPGEVARTLEQADALVDAGLATDAIRVLTDANRATPSPAFETRLVDVRHLAFAPGTPTASTPPPRVTARPEPPGPLLPLTAADLTPARLRAEMAEHGCVYVRGLVGRDRIAELRAGIDRALEGFDATDGAGGSTAPWYEPFRPRPEYQVVGKRNWVRASGAVWTVDSPRMLFALTELVEDSGIAALITDYLGERPALSANKCTLRRVPVDTATNWHQDGAFLGGDVRSLNLWLALSDVDADSPGLEIVPRRFDRVLPTGTDGATFDWSVSPTIVEEVAVDAPVLRPDFAAGDALLFDHLFLHRTAAGPGMTRERYAMENWFFAPSAYPDGQIPVLL